MDEPKMSKEELEELLTVIEASQKLKNRGWTFKEILTAIKHADWQLQVFSLDALKKEYREKCL